MSSDRGSSTAPRRPPRLPFQERKSPLRGLLDLATLRCPPFLLGGPLLPGALPVFHFHEVTAAALEPYLAYLSANHYAALTSDALSALVLRGVRPPKRSVVLTFDDAWLSFATDALPLLRKYALPAILYVSPGRTPPDDRPGALFCSWPVLRSLRDSGFVDIQAHSFAHARVFSHPAVLSFLSPADRFHPHDLPAVPSSPADPASPLRLLAAADLGTPLRLARSRLSSACQWLAPEADDACTAYVRAHGGPDFFSRPDWAADLRRVLASAPPGRPETPAERDEAIYRDLLASRRRLEDELSAPVTHMCVPWAVSSAPAIAAARRAGFVTACSDRLFGPHVAVHAPRHPFQIMRLKHQWLPSLPGTPRRFLSQNALPPASAGRQIRPLPLAEIPPLYP